MVDVGEHTGALVLTAPAEREGIEVEIHPASDPSRRTHVWVLPRAGRHGTVYAAVFPSLPAGRVHGARAGRLGRDDRRCARQPGDKRHLGMTFGQWGRDGRPEPPSPGCAVTGQAVCGVVYASAVLVEALRSSLGLTA